tara:strand:- start:1415 stop:1921 length:507 start_codon:yes stop_codon:yes gene_type:complete
MSSKNKSKVQPVKPQVKVITKPAATAAKSPVAKAPLSTNRNKAQSMAQQRASFALEKVAAVAQDKDTAKRFKAYANSLPAMIQTNGLGQALAFAKAKGCGKGPEAPAWHAMYKALNSWLTLQEIWGAEQDVLNALVNGNQYQYRRAQAETQALLVWIKQISRAELAGD